MAASSPPGELQAVDPSLGELVAGAPSPLVGLDCGGSATRAVLIVDGAVVARPQLAATHALVDPDAFALLSQALVGLKAALVGIGLPGARLAAAAAIPGVPRALEATGPATSASRECDPETLEARLAAATGAEVVVCSDVEAARCGAFAGGHGVVVVAGTGSSAYGVDRAGVSAAAGGHGYLIGDDGSAYAIGRAALSAALRARDGLGPPTDLGAELAAASRSSLEALIAEIHRYPADRSLICQLAPVVTASRDPVAAAITRDAGAALGRLADVVQARIGPLPLVGMGKVLGAAPVRRVFGDGRAVGEPRFDAAIGAALVAVERWRREHSGGPSTASSR